MSTSYCVLNINKAALIGLLSDDNSFGLKDIGDGLLEISMPISGRHSKKYTLEKRIFVAKQLKLSPDDIGNGSSNKSVICLDRNASDKNNTHFVAYSEYMLHPEMALTAIVLLATSNGFESARFISERDKEYAEMFDEDITEDDIPK